MDTRTFPIQSDYRDTKAHPTTIPWEVADKAYAVYRGRYGSQQTLERLAERGGFSGGEMDELYPGWRDEVSGIAVRDARIAALEAQVKALTEERDAQAEAVRVLAEEVNAAWKWNDADMYDRPDTWDNATSDAVRANPIARAAVEGGKP